WETRRSGPATPDCGLDATAGEPFGIRSIPQMGHLPGLSETTSGCIAHVHFCAEAADAPAEGFRAHAASRAIPAKRRAARSARPAAAAGLLRFRMDSSRRRSPQDQGKTGGFLKRGHRARGSRFALDGFRLVHVEVRRGPDVGEEIDRPDRVRLPSGSVVDLGLGQDRLAIQAGPGPGSCPGPPGPPPVPAPGPPERPPGGLSPPKPPPPPPPPPTPPP